MNNNINPYFTNQYGTTIYGNNRPGVVNWEKFDKEIASMVEPATRDIPGSMSESIGSILKAVVVGFFSSLVVFFILFHIMGLHVIGWFALLGLMFVYPAWVIVMEKRNHDEVLNETGGAKKVERNMGEGEHRYRARSNVAV